MPFEYLQAIDDLSPIALTIRAQVIPPSDAGRLIYPTLFPEQDVDSTVLKDVMTLDDRPVSDRREWNAPGRFIPLVTPAYLDTEMVPVEGYDKIDEKEMNTLSNQTRGNAAIVQQIIGAGLPDRVRRIVLANFRRVELDGIEAWTAGHVTQRNPQDASKTFQASLGFAVGRIQTAGTAWSDPGLNAYDEFVAWYLDGVDLMGDGAGAMLRRATYNAILADAPNLSGGQQMTRAMLETQIQQDIAGAFRFFINETSFDPFDDGGTAKTRTKEWPVHKLAFIPASEVVGSTKKAPVNRAQEFAREAGEQAGIDVRGQTVYYFEENHGKELVIEVQYNAMAVPSEQLTWIMDAGV